MFVNFHSFTHFVSGLLTAVNFQRTCFPAFLVPFSALHLKVAKTLWYGQDLWPDRRGQKVTLTCRMMYERQANDRQSNHPAQLGASVSWIVVSGTRRSTAADPSYYVQWNRGDQLWYSTLSVHRAVRWLWLWFLVVSRSVPVHDSNTVSYAWQPTLPTQLSNLVIFDACPHLFTNATRDNWQSNAVSSSFCLSVHHTLVLCQNG